MFHHFSEYHWKMGKPYGTGIVDSKEAATSYKIVTDPYFKRISIEKYQTGQFEKVVYDSIFLDFRHLTAKDQMAWQRELLEELGNRSIYLLRNQEDRAVLVETMEFHQNQCRSCTTSSIHGIVLCRHRMHYQSLGDPFNGVTLFDLEERAVMIKKYDIDPLTGEFTQLLSENWDMQDTKTP